MLQHAVTADTVGVALAELNKECTHTHAATRVAHGSGTGWRGPTWTPTHETRTRTGMSMFFHFGMFHPVSFFLFFVFGMYDIFFTIVP